MQRISEGVFASIGDILENCMKEAKYLDSVDSQEIHQMILKTAYDEFSGEK